MRTLFILIALTSSCALGAYTALGYLVTPWVFGCIDVAALAGLYLAYE